MKKKRGKMEKPKDHKITVIDCDNRRLSLTVSWDANIDGWVEAFKVILKWITFADETIEEAFVSQEDR